MQETARVGTGDVIVLASTDRVTVVVRCLVARLSVSGRQLQRRHHCDRFTLAR